MNFMNRACLYVMRKKGKSILLFIILFMISTFVLTALALGNASDAAQKNLRKSLGGEFTVGCDYSENNPYLKTESVDGGVIYYSTQQISPNLVEKIRNLEGVVSCSATNETLSVFSGLNIFVGTIPIEEQFRRSQKTIGVWKSEENSLFTSGKLILVEGRHITPEDKNKILISKDLAEKNGLKTGDRLLSQQGIECEIAGLFTPRELESITEQVTSYDKIQNLVLTDLSTLIAEDNSPAIQGFNEIKVVVSDPEDMGDIITRVRKIQGVDWSGFDITAENEGYQNASASLQQLSGLISAFLIVTLIVSTAVLSLILTMWARSRIHETGVLLSVGIHKISILGQYIAEVLMIAVIAFLLSYFSSGAVAEKTGNILQAKQSAADELKDSDNMASGARSGVSESAADAAVLIDTPELKVTVDFREMLLLFAAGTGIIMVSAGIASITVMRLKPREILSRMS